MRARMWRWVWRACFNAEIWAMNRWERYAPDEVAAKNVELTAEQS